VRRRYARILDVRADQSSAQLVRLVEHGAFRQMVLNLSQRDSGWRTGGHLGCAARDRDVHVSRIPPQLASGPGYRTDHLLMMMFDPTLVRYSNMQSQQFFQQVAERARQVPGVTRVTMTTSIPMLNDPIGASMIAPEGYQFPSGQQSVSVLSSMVDEHYFETMEIAILKGRNFLVTDDIGAPSWRS
jgi:hypothetical protein